MRMPCSQDAEDEEEAPAPLRTNLENHWLDALTVQALVLWSSCPCAIAW